MARPVTDKTGQIVKPTQTALTPKQKTDQLINQMAPYVLRVAGDGALANLLLNELRLNAELREAEPASILGTLLTLAQHKVTTSKVMGEAFINVRQAKDGKKYALPQFMYQYYVRLLYNSGQVKNIRGHVVHEGDDFEMDLGDDEKLIHKPLLDGDPAQRKIRGAYIIIEKTNGAMVRKYLPWAVIDKRHKQHSDAVKKGKSSAWDTNPEAMCLKSVLIEMKGLLAKSIDDKTAAAIAVDSQALVDDRQLNGVAYDPKLESIVAEAGFQLLPDEGLSLPGAAVDPTTGEIVKPGASGAVSEGQDEGGMGLNDIVAQIAKITKQKPEDILKRIEAQKADLKSQKEIASFMLDDAQAWADEEAAGQTRLAAEERGQRGGLGRDQGIHGATEVANGGA